MILPSKHLSEKRALLTVGGEVLRLLDKPRTVSSVWEAIKQGVKGNAMPRRLSYDWFVLSLDLLFIMDAIILRDGLLIKNPSAQ
ncbi:MAG: ABC-three component system middle component 6 [Prosthecobacter sp.]